jgi:hypothetical protein
MTSNHLRPLWSSSWTKQSYLLGRCQILWSPLCGLLYLPAVRFYHSFDSALQPSLSRAVLCPKLNPSIRLTFEPHHLNLVIPESDFLPAHQPRPLHIIDIALSPHASRHCPSTLKNRIVHTNSEPGICCLHTSSARRYRGGITCRLICPSQRLC